VDDERRHINTIQVLRKSSCQVGTHARLAIADAPAAMFQLARTTSSLTRLPKS
jgi:hypothetical protein